MQLKNKISILGTTLFSLLAIAQEASAYTPDPSEGWVPYNTNEMIDGKNPGSFPAAGQGKKPTQATNREFIYTFANSDQLYYRFGAVSPYTTDYENNDPLQMLSAHRDLNFGYNLRKYPATPGGSPDLSTNGGQSIHATLAPAGQQERIITIGTTTAQPYSPSFDLVIDGVDILKGSNDPTSYNYLGTTSGASNNLSGNKDPNRNDMKVTGIWVREPDPNNPKNDALGTDILQLSEWGKIQLVKRSYILGSTILVEYMIVNNDTVDHTSFARTATWLQQRVWSMGPNQGTYTKNSLNATNPSKPSETTPVELRAVTYYPGGPTEDERFDIYGVNPEKANYNYDMYSLQAAARDRTVQAIQPGVSTSSVNKYKDMPQREIPKNGELFSKLGVAGGTGVTSSWQVPGHFAMTPVGTIKPGESFTYKRVMELTNNNAKKMNFKLDDKFKDEIVVLRGEKTDIYGTYQSQYDKNLSFLLAGSSQTTSSTIDHKGNISLTYDVNNWPDDVKEENWSTTLNTEHLDIGEYDVELTGIGDYSGRLDGTRKVKLKVVTAAKADAVPGYFSKKEILEIKAGNYVSTSTEGPIELLTNISDDQDQPEDMNYSYDPRQDFDTLATQGEHELIVSIENTQGTTKNVKVPIYVIDRDYALTKGIPNTGLSSRRVAISMDYAGISKTNYPATTALPQEKYQYFHEEDTKLQFHYIEGNQFLNTETTTINDFVLKYPNLFVGGATGTLDIDLSPIPTPALEETTYNFENEFNQVLSTTKLKPIFEFYFKDETAPTANGKTVYLNHIDELPEPKDLIENLQDALNPNQDPDKIKIEWNLQNTTAAIENSIKTNYMDGGSMDVLIDITDDAGNTRTITATFTMGTLIFKEVPTKIDFGEHKIFAETKGKFAPSQYDGKLEIEDNRPARSSWTLSAKLQSPFKTSDDGTISTVALLYNDGAGDIVLNGSTNSIHTEKGITATSANNWNLSNDWTQTGNTKGFYLDVKEGDVKKLGKYTTVIEFTLENTPGF